MAVLTVKAAANRIGVSVALVYHWVEAKLLTHYRAGFKGKRGKVLIEESDLLAFWDTLKVTPEPRCETKAPVKTNLKLKHITLD